MINRILSHLTPLFILLSPSLPIEVFEAYVLGLIENDRYFSGLGASRKTETVKLWKFYDLLKQKIYWNKIFYVLAKSVIYTNNNDSWYLIIDASPIDQPYSKYRITKRAKIKIVGMKNVPHNMIISLVLTNGINTMVLDFRIWVSKKVAKPYDYIKQTTLALDLLKKYNLHRMPVKTVLIDSAFSSKEILTWLNKNEYNWFTRIKKSRLIYINRKKYRLEDIELKIGCSINCELRNIRTPTKILKTSYQNEEVYIATNHIHLTDVQIESLYKMRWKIELFHREAKQHLGLDYIRIESYRAMVNHVGFVCLAFSLLSLQHKSKKDKIGSIKRTIQDELYSTHDAIDRFARKKVS
jgi:hypothetical protein